MKVARTAASTQEQLPWVALETREYLVDKGSRYQTNLERHDLSAMNPTDLLALPPIHKEPR